MPEAAIIEKASTVHTLQFKQKSRVELPFIDNETIKDYSLCIKPVPLVQSVQKFSYILSIEPNKGGFLDNIYG